MKKTITNRQKEIIIILATSFNDEVITMSKIAKILGLSTRTVLREMNIIEDWLIKNDFNLIKKPGIGLIIDESEENKKYILELINQEKVEKSFTEEERKFLILSNLLSTNEPIKTRYFQKNLKVSENILNLDFKNVQNWLSNFNINLVKKQGIGCYLEGDERNFRTAYVSLIYEFYNETEFLSIFDNTKKNNNIIKNYIAKSVIEILDKNTITRIIKILDKNIKESNINISDNSYIELLINISLAIKKIINNEKIFFEKAYFEGIDKIYQFKIAKKIAEDLEKEFDINIPIDEVVCIAINLKASKLGSEELKNELMIDDTNMLDVSIKLIKLVEKEVNIILIEDKVFLKALTNHLNSSIYRMKNNMKIRNVFLKEIKSEYEELYLIISKNINFIKDLFNIKNIPEEEIAFITMHFEAAIERILLIKTNINIVISCPTGIGTSKILFQKLKDKFKNIKILQTISSLKIEDDYLNKKNVDLIISTVKLDTSLNYICVSPIFTFEDEDKLKKVLLSIAKDKLKNSNINKDFIDNKEELIKEKDLFDIMNIGKEILELLNNFELLENVNINSLDELIHFSSNLFSDNKENVNLLYSDIKKRVSISFPYFEEIDMLFLHCLSEAVYFVKLAVIRLDKAIFYDNKKIEYIFVMIIPKNYYEYQQQILSEISYNLVDNENLINSFKFLNREEIINILKTIFLKYFSNKLKNLEILEEK